MRNAVTLAWGDVDHEGVSGTAGVNARWADLGVAAPGSPASFRQLFGSRDPTFRRLDRLSRTLVVATAAMGLDRILASADRSATAIVIETATGCLDSDRDFAASLATGIPDGPRFPYTLPSTCLGEVALRHGLRGASICLSLDDSHGPAPSAARQEALAILAAGEAPFVLTGRVEVLTAVAVGEQDLCRARVELLALDGS